MKLFKSNIIAEGTNSICRTIEWSAPAYAGNAPYGGKCQVIAVFADDSHPIHSVTISGDNLDFAFWNVDGELCYSDEDRIVNYNVVEG